MAVFRSYLSYTESIMYLKINNLRDPFSYFNLLADIDLVLYGRTNP